MRSINGGSNARRFGTWRTGTNEMATYRPISATSAIASRRVPAKRSTNPAKRGTGKQRRHVLDTIEDRARLRCVEAKETLRQHDSARVETGARSAPTHMP